LRTDSFCLTSILASVFPHYTFNFTMFYQQMSSLKLRENLKRWIFKLMKLNIAWKCTCHILLKYLKG